MGLWDTLFGSSKPKGATPKSCNGLKDAALEQAIKRFERRAWKPITINSDGDPSASKFSGTPWLSDKEEWPKCQHCSKPLQLFVQLNSRDLPEAANQPFGSGILQLFYCTNSETECEQHCDAWSPFAKSVVGRIVSASGTPKQVSLLDSMFPPKLISSWESVIDYPNSEELKTLGVSFDWKDYETFGERYLPKPGDKLLGWPYWVQGIEYFECPKCKKLMQYIFQIDSDNNLPYMFGDAGCGHITYCPCQQVVAFGWACC